MTSPKTKICAEIVAHSLSPQGDELVTVLATFPRIILAEVNTHKMLEKNTSSSRAIPFFKMVTSIQEDCFVPIAWQKHHSGMQGSEYITPFELINTEHFVEDYIKMVKIQAEADKVELSPEFMEVLDTMHKTLIGLLSDQHWHTVVELWMKIKDLTIFSATTLYVMGGVTKQLANRLLEPFMWTTMLITGPRNHGGWDNFFKLRCPQYTVGNNEPFKSSKDFNNVTGREHSKEELQRYNKGHAEIHMMALAEAIWDAMNESVPKQLKAGEWHIPFEDKINVNDVKEITINNLKLEGEDYGELEISKWYNEVQYEKVKLSVAMAARTSYTVVGEEKELNYDSLFGLHKRLLNQNPPHSSPFGHAARAMSDEEYRTFLKGTIQDQGCELEQYEEGYSQDVYVPKNSQGWCTNVKGFITYRYIVENKLTM